MSFKLELFVTCILTQLLISKSSDDPIIIQMNPEEIVNTFKNVINSNYIKQMAEEMATSAAKHFIKEIKTKEIEMQEMLKTASPSIKSKQAKISSPVERNVEKEKVSAKKPVVQIQKVKKTPSSLESPNIPIIPQIPQIPQMPQMPQMPTMPQKPSLPPISKHREDQVSPRAPKKGELDEDTAFALLKEPSPDGDDWVMDSLEITQMKNDVPAVEVMKINGKYFRRMFHMLSDSDVILVV